MASRQTTSKNAQKKGASRKAAPKQGAAKLRANAQAAPEFVPEPLFTGGTARDISGVVLAVFAVASFIAVIAPTTAPVAAAVAGFYHLGFGLGGDVLPLALLFVSALVRARRGGLQDEDRARRAPHLRRGHLVHRLGRASRPHGAWRYRERGGPFRYGRRRRLRGFVGALQVRSVSPSPGSCSLASHLPAPCS